MHLRCGIQLTNCCERATIVVRHDIGGEVTAGYWLVHRNQLIFDEVGFEPAPIFGIEPGLEHLTQPTGEGSVAVMVDSADDGVSDLVTVSMPTADPSDAWVWINVPRADLVGASVLATA